jgi:hypothetical protein
MAVTAATANPPYSSRNMAALPFSASAGEALLPRHRPAHLCRTVPSDPHARPAGEVVALNGKYQSFRMPGSYSFSRLMVQSGDAILVRVPLR